MIVEITPWIAAAIPILGMASGFGGASVVLTEHARRIRENSIDIKTLETHKDDVVDRLARMETKIDLILRR